MPAPTRRSAAPAAWLESLRLSGYRLTGPRRAIVSILAGSAHALGPAEVHALGRRQYPGLGLVTVYRTLEALEALGLVQRVHQPGGCHMYLRAPAGHQHLLLCTHCGRAEHFSGDDLSELMQAITARSGFEIREHWLQLLGLCAACRRTG